MSIGLPDNEIAAIKECLSKIPRIDQAIVFGSRAIGKYKSSSDIDIVLKGKDLTEKDIAQLETSIDDLLLPYKFDFVLFSTISNDDLLEHISRIGKQIYP
ncbi:MAG: DNA polymerase [Melioribacteraceae bacterium]|nr:MAG: DNA polymerase [Melioribacteraceae bacterium]